jgi:hypothetical protein
VRAIQGVQGAPAAQNGRNIQQYFVLAGTRPPSADTARVVPLNPPAGTVRVGPAASNAAAGAQDTRAQPAAPSDAAAAGDPNDHSWFAAAMLRGAERYRETRRSQDGAAPSVDRTE